MVSHAIEYLLLLTACMSDPVETQLNSRLKGSKLFVVTLSDCTHATIHTLDVPMRIAQSRQEILHSFGDCYQQGLRSEG